MTSKALRRRAACDLPGQAWLISDNRQINKPPLPIFHQPWFALGETSNEQALGLVLLHSISSSHKSVVARRFPRDLLVRKLPTGSHNRPPPSPVRSLMRPVGPEIKLETSPRNFFRSYRTPRHDVISCGVQVSNQFELCHYTGAMSRLIMPQLPYFDETTVDLGPRIGRPLPPPSYS